MLESNKGNVGVVHRLTAQIEELKNTIEQNEKEFGMDMQLIEKLHKGNHTKDAQINKLNSAITDLNENIRNTESEREKQEIIFSNKINELERIIDDLKRENSIVIAQQKRVKNELYSEQNKNKRLETVLTKYKQELDNSNKEVMELEDNLDKMFMEKKYRIERGMMEEDTKDSVYDSVMEKLHLQDSMLGNYDYEDY